MDLDIAAALAASNLTPTGRRCKLQKQLDVIPDDHPQKPDLLAAVADEQRHPATRLSVTFSLLELPVSKDIIREHRGKVCACYR